MTDFSDQILTWLPVIPVIIAIVALYVAGKSNKKAEESNRIAEESKEIAKKALDLPSMKIHSDELKEFLKDWETSFPRGSRVYQLETNPTSFSDRVFVGPNKKSIVEIEREELYKDFMENHVRDPEFKQTWEEYKKKANLYGEKRYKFFIRLKEEIEKETGMPCSENYSEHSIMEYFLDPIYESYVQRLKNEPVDDSTEPQEEPVHNKETLNLRYRGTVIANGFQNEIKKAKVVFKDHINSSEYFDRVKRQVEEIVDINDQIDKRTLKIIDYLKKFQKVAIYSESCEFNKIF